MLPNKNRLTLMKDYEILHKEGRFVAGPPAGGVNLKVWKIDPAKYPRRQYSIEDLKIGFVVGVKIHKSAVKRNRVKRQLREIVRLLLKDNKIKPGFMVSFLVKKEILDKEYKEVEKDLLVVLKRTNLLR